MTERPFDIAELEAILALPPDHPRRLELETDPRFRAIARSYQRFLDAGDGPADAMTERAEARLDAYIDRMVQDEATPTSPARPWYRSWRPYLVSGLAAAAVVLMLMSTRNAYERQAPGRALRWEETATIEIVRLVPGTPVDLDGERRRIDWYRLPAADRYAVAFYRSDLNRVGLLDAGGDTSLTVDRDRLTDLCGPEGSAVFRVLATAGADTIARSAPAVVSY